MKKTLLLIALMLFACQNVCAEDYIHEQEKAAGTEKITEFYSRHKDEPGFDFDFEKLTESIYSGDFRLSFSGALEYVAELFTGGLKKSVSVIIMIIMIAIVCAFASRLSVFGRGGGAAFYVCFSVICGMCATVFCHVVKRSIYAIELMSDFIKVTAPTLTTLCAAGGEIGNASVLSPLLYAVSAVAITVTNTYLIPLAYGAFSLNAVGSIGDGVDLGRCVKLMKSFSKWIMALIMTVFSGVSVICSTVGGAMNAIAGKTVKFAVGSFVPIVGSMLADSIDMVTVCTGVVKRAVGAGGMLTIMLIFISYATELAASFVLFRCAAAFSSLLCDEKTVNLLDGTADCISIIIAIFCMCSFLFLIIITIIICGVMQ